MSTVDIPLLTATVLFDGDCGLCRSLAELAARRAGGELAFVPWQEYARGAEQRGELPSGLSGKPERLSVLAGDALLTGETAWSFLLGRYRDLAGLNWLASRLGLAPETARVLETSAALLKRFCGPCRRP